MARFQTLLLKGRAVAPVLTGPLGILFSGVLFYASPGIAQLIPDGTTGTQIQPDVEVQGLPSDLIEGGTIRNQNLFHSFEAFNVEADRGIYFAAQTGILNILTRVTGDGVSNIDGTLGVLGNADLFLINPNGIVFGPDAQLDLSGSFVGSTAASILFENYEFSAESLDTPPLLTLSVPLGLRMGTSPGALQVDQATLSVDQALTLAADVLDISGELQAGGDITLRGQERQLNTGTFTTGGYFLTQDLDGTNVDFLIPHASVIRADGDVQIAGYTGSSLYVLAGGHVTVGDGADSIAITDAGSEVPNSVTTTIADGIGGTQSITVSATGEPTVDIRTGVDWIQLPEGVPGNENLSSAQAMFGNSTDASAVTDAGIQLGDVSNSGGRVVLSDRFVPNEALSGAIQVGAIDTSTAITTIGDDLAVGTDGGDILISGRGSITTADLDTSASTTSEAGDIVGGSGGDIAIASISGDVTIDTLLTNAESYSYSSYYASGDISGGVAGNISISTTSGQITTAALEARSQSDSLSFLGSSAGDIAGGNGGDIAIASISGDVTTSTLLANAEADSYAFYYASGDISGGAAGNVSLSTTSGQITTTVIEAESRSDSESYLGSFGTTTGGSGGDVTVSTLSGDITIADGLSSASVADGGEVMGGSGGNIVVTTDTGDITSITGALASQSIATSYSGYARGGDGGQILLSTITGNIDIPPDNNEIDRVFSSSSAFLALDGERGDVIGGNGGDIAITSVTGNVTMRPLNSASYAYDLGLVNSNSATLNGSITGGNGGNIAITTLSGDITTAEVRSFSASTASYSTVSGGDGGDIAITTETGNLNFTNSEPDSTVLDTSSIAYLPTYSVASSGASVGGDGGTITLSTMTGNIVLANVLSSFSYVTAGRAGNGGDVVITTDQGNLVGPSGEIANTLNSFAVSRSGSESGNGGNVTLAANNQITNLDIFTIASGAEAGTVNITGSGDLVLERVNTVTSTSVAVEVVVSEIFDNTITFAIGNIGQSGNVAITGVGDLTLQDSSIESTAQGAEPAGNVSISSPGLITLQDNSSVSSNTNSTGNAGNIRLASDTGILLTGPGVSLDATSNAEGNAGKIELDAPTITVEEGAAISTVTNADGTAGDIRLTTATLTLVNNSEILASSSGAGDGGEIVIDAATAVNLGEGVQDFAPVISVETSGAGTAGDIIINTPSFTLAETARITATATATATTPETGGSITLNASAMDLAGTVGIFAETAGQAPAGTLTLQPFDANFENANLEPGEPQFDPHLIVTLASGSAISASTAGQGQGGGLRVLAPESITIAGPGQFAVETLGPGNGGNIEIITRRLTLTDSVELSASTFADVPIPIIETTHILQY